MFDNISPLDHRYYLANGELFDRLRLYLSETATVTYSLRAETALLRAHIHFEFDDDASLLEAVDGLDGITPDEVYQEEERTQHNVRALVNVIQRYLPEKLRPYVHLGATSVDILDTSFAMRIRDAIRLVVLPLLIELEHELIEKAHTEAETPQVGRTHGQHAVPITFGFALAEYVSRLGNAVEEIERRSADLRGKLSGAVGAYNATGVMTGDPEGLERYYLDSLGLTPSEIATQIVPPEYLLRLLTEIEVAFGIIANLADDIRHLQRSEIDEVREFFSDSQVGSSTMPQKRNPWNSEHVKSLWKAFAPRVMTFFMDQISEHQRDLSNSASSRFIVEFIAGFTAATERMRRIIHRLSVHGEQMREMIVRGGGRVLAEPAYILLALSGDEAAHETIRQVTLSMEEHGGTFAEALRRMPEAWESIGRELHARLGIEAEEFFSSPERYRGIAYEKTEAVTAGYNERMKRVEEKL